MEHDLDEPVGIPIPTPQSFPAEGMPFIKIYSDLGSGDRNKAGQEEAVRKYLSGGYKILEIASGFGEAISYFANSHRDVVFTPTDPQVPCIHRLRELAAAHRNMTPPLKLNIFSPSHWKKAEAEGPFDGILCFNLLHLIPWHGTGILLDQASRLLEEEKGFLAIYGPFLREGAFMSEPDRQFDQDIRSRDEEWGLRDLEEVTRWASEFNFKKEEVREMRAGNWMLILRRL